MEPDGRMEETIWEEQTQGMDLDRVHALSKLLMTNMYVHTGMDVG